MTMLACAVLAFACAKRETGGSSSNASDRGAAGSGGAAGDSPVSGAGAAGIGTAGLGAGGASGGAGATSTGGSGSGSAGNGSAGNGLGGNGGSGGGQSCPPRDCVRETWCATSCDAAPFNNGCCNCPDGMIDTIVCSSGGQCQGAPGCGEEEGAPCCDPTPCDGPNFCRGGLQCCGAGVTCAAECDSNVDGRCTIPCSGLAPDPQVAQDCYSFTTQAQCTAYQSTEFPFQCAWVVGPQEPCLAP